MLKKLSIAGLALLASSGIALADSSDSMATDPAMATDNGTSTATTSTAPKKHKKHHKKHKKHHYRTAAAAPAPVAATDQDPAYSAPKGDYKGEIAAPCPTCPPPFMAGAYLGLGIGSVVNYDSRPAAFNGFQGTLFGGYGWLWDQWYGALEVFVQDSASIVNYNRKTVNGNVQSSWGYGASILPGYTILENVLAYLRLGVVDTKFTGTGASWAVGGQVGLGLETVLCNNWDLRGEYIYGFYKGIGGSNGSPKSQQFNLELLYKFQV